VTDLADDEVRGKQQLRLAGSLRHLGLQSLLRGCCQWGWGHCSNCPVCAVLPADIGCIQLAASYASFACVYGQDMASATMT